MLTRTTLQPTLTRLAQRQRECFRGTQKNDGTRANSASTWDFSVVSTCPPLPLGLFKEGSGSVTEDGLINYAYAKPECESPSLSGGGGTPTIGHTLNVAQPVILNWLRVRSHYPSPHCQVQNVKPLPIGTTK